LIAEASRLIASSWPKTTRFRSRSRCSSVFLSSDDTLFAGIRAMVEMTCSISLVVIVFLRLLGGTSICIAPTSSITSIALSGSLRSLM
jgi:hypothetical protein